MTGDKTSDRKAPPTDEERRAAVARTAARQAGEVWGRTYVKDGVRYVRSRRHGRGA
jgi:hypothetical protein